MASERDIEQMGKHTRIATLLRAHTHARTHTHTHTLSLSLSLPPPLAHRLADVHDRLQQSANDLQSTLKRSTEAADVFEEIRAERCRLFRDAFDHVQSEIKSIYKVRALSCPSAVSLLREAHTTSHLQPPPLAVFHRCRRSL